MPFVRIDRREPVRMVLVNFGRKINKLPKLLLCEDLFNNDFGHQVFISGPRNKKKHESGAK